MIIDSAFAVGTLVDDSFCARDNTPERQHPGVAQLDTIPLEMVMPADKVGSLITAHTAQAARRSLLVTAVTQMLDCRNKIESSS